MRRMKRFLCVLLAGLCVCTLFSCAKNQTEDTENTDTATSKGVSYYFEYNGTKVELGENVDGVIEALGAYKDKKEIGDCGGLGAQVKYSYASFDVYVLESKTDGNIVDQITFRDDIVSTNEGVCIGSELAVNVLYFSYAFLYYGIMLNISLAVFNLLPVPPLDGSKLLRLGISDGVVDEIDYMTVTE